MMVGGKIARRAYLCKGYLWCDLFRQSRHWAGFIGLTRRTTGVVEKAGYDLNGAKKLVFWAKGEHGGEQIAELKWAV